MLRISSTVSKKKYKFNTCCKYIAATLLWVRVIHSVFSRSDQQQTNISPKPSDYYLSLGDIATIWDTQV